MDAKQKYAALNLTALLLGNAVLACGPWLVRLADTGPVSAGFWRLALPIPVFAAIVWWSRKSVTFDRRLLLLGAGAGLFFALDIGSWHVGIEQTRLGNAVLFGNAGSLVLMGWGLFGLGRTAARRDYVAVIAALGGGAILLGRSLSLSTESFVGDLFCLFAGLCYAFYLLPAQAARAASSPSAVLLIVCCVAAPVLLLMAIIAGEPVVPGPAGWGPVVLLALSSQLVGQGLLVFALRHFSALVIGLALMTQPVVASLIGWRVFGEALTPLDMLGMAMVGGALVLARRQPSNRFLKPT